MDARVVPRQAPAGVLRGGLPPHLLRLAPDARLVALIRAGRPAAFEVAYDRHHRGILSFCRHMLSDPQEAEDAVQHTFLAAYSGLLGSDKPIQLRPWLFAIARNRCYSVLRTRREQPAVPLDDVAGEGLAALVQRRQDLRDLLLDMRRLPPDQRAALVLAELDALSHEQIGAALGVSREKVRALVFQARESLVANRAARETDCAEIRTVLATQRGGALRRGNLRRHLRVCPGCREFRRQVERQRRQLAVLLPVAPALVLKEAVLAGVGSGAGVGFAGGAGLVASTMLKSGMIKSLGLVLAGVGTAGTIVVTDPDRAHPSRPVTRAPARLAMRGGPAPGLRLPARRALSPGASGPGPAGPPAASARPASHISARQAMPPVVAAARPHAPGSSSFVSSTTHRRPVSRRRFVASSGPAASVERSRPPSAPVSILAAVAVSPGAGRSRPESGGGAFADRASVAGRDVGVARGSQQAGAVAEDHGATGGNGGGGGDGANGGAGASHDGGNGGTGRSHGAGNGSAGSHHGG